jgi:hypothetical protein
MVFTGEGKSFRGINAGGGVMTFAEAYQYWREAQQAIDRLDGETTTDDRWGELLDTDRCSVWDSAASGYPTVA